MSYYGAKSGNRTPHMEGSNPSPTTCSSKGSRICGLFEKSICVPFCVPDSSQEKPADTRIRVLPCYHGEPPLRILRSAFRHADQPQRRPSAASALGHLRSSLARSRP